MKKRCTLKDIALRADLAPTTVSRILNNKPTYCSEAKIALVRQVAQELGYIRNLGYQIMTGEETRTVGVMISCDEYIQEEHIRTILLKLTGKFSDKGYFTANHVLPREPEKAFAAVENYIAHGVSRFVFLGTPFGYQEIFAMLKKAKIPFIGNRFSSMPRYACFDSMNGRKKLLDVLREKCGENFCVFWWKHDRVTIQNLFSGVKNLIVDLLHTSDDLYNNAFSEGRHRIAAAFRHTPGLRGALFPNDAYAIGAAHWLHENGIRDFTLAGSNGDREFLRFPYPGYTTYYDTEKMAEILSERVFDNEPCRESINVEIIKTGKDII